jgi:hypothetical protein
MRKQVSTTLIVAFFGVTTAAQNRPDFSGQWTMDRTRSESAMQTEPVGSRTVTIAQSDTILELNITQDGRSTAFAYRLDGTPSPIPGGTAVSHWEAGTLVTETIRTIQGQTVTTKERRHLAGGGDEMLVETVLVVQHGYTLSGTQNYGAGKDVFVRAR